MLSKVLRGSLLRKSTTRMMVLPQVYGFSSSAMTPAETLYTTFTADSDMTFQAIVKSMGEMQKNDLTYEEYTEYHPMADELVHYFDINANAEEMTQLDSEKLTSLVSFGSTFGISSKDYWGSLTEALQNTDVVNKLDGAHTIEIMNSLKENNLLSQQMHISLLSHLLTKTRDLNKEQLAVALLILKSHDSQLALKDAVTQKNSKWSKLMNKFETDLKGDQMDASNFGKICYCIDEEIKLEGFMDTHEPQLKEWIKNSQISYDDIPFILNAVNVNDYDVNVISDIEHNIVENFTRLTPRQAANLIIHCGQHIKNPELVEICEKLVVNGLNEIALQRDGHSMVLQAFNGFCSNEHSRPKVLEVLIAKITEDIDLLDVSEQNDFMEILKEIKE